MADIHILVVDNYEWRAKSHKELMEKVGIRTFKRVEHFYSGVINGIPTAKLDYCINEISLEKLRSWQAVYAERKGIKND